MEKNNVDNRVMQWYMCLGRPDLMKICGVNLYIIKIRINIEINVENRTVNDVVMND